MSNLKNYDQIKKKINREQELLRKVINNRYKNKLPTPETYEEFVEECKKYLTEDEYKELFSLRPDVLEYAKSQSV